MCGWRTKIGPIRRLWSQRMLHGSAGRIRFFDLIANGMEIVCSRNHRKQQHQETAEENDGAKTTWVPKALRAD